MAASLGAKRPPPLQPATLAAKPRRYREGPSGRHLSQEWAIGPSLRGAASERPHEVEAGRADFDAACAPWARMCSVRLLAHPGRPCAVRAASIYGLNVPQGLPQLGRASWLRPVTCFDWCRAAHHLRMRLRAFGVVGDESSYRALWTVRCILLLGAWPGKARALPYMLFWGSMRSLPSSLT